MAASALAETISVKGDEAASRLDPRAGVTLQAVWFDFGEGLAGRLLIAVHHLVADGMSWRILVPDLAVAYAAVADGETPALEASGMSFRRWALLLAAQATEAERAKELAIWTNILQDGDPPLGKRRLDPQRDTTATLQQTSLTVPVDLTVQLLTSVPAAFHAGIDDVLLAAFTAAVSDWRRRHSGKSSTGILIDIEHHGRISLTVGMDLSRTVGWFTSRHPVRLDVREADLGEVRAGGPAAGQVVKLIKEQLRIVPADGLGYGLLRYLNPDTAPALATLPVPQIGFNYLGRFADASGSHEMLNGDGPGDWQPADDMALTGNVDTAMPAAHVLEAGGLVWERSGGPEMNLSLAWPAEVIDQSAARELVEGWLAMLQGLAAHVAEPGAGGHTPSDFPLAPVTQSEIEEFEAMAAELEKGIPQ
jgi:nonribosomal peptide synthetase CepB